MYLIALDGVLRAANGAVLPDGVRLAADLAKESGKVVVATDGSTKDATIWLKQNGFTFHSSIVGEEYTYSSQCLRLRQALSLRDGQSYLVVIESDPDVAEVLIKNGLSTALFAKSRYVHPKHRFSESRARSWADVLADLDEKSDAAEHSDYE